MVETKQVGKLYSSQRAEFRLDSRRVFEVTIDISLYLLSAKNRYLGDLVQYINENPDFMQEGNLVFGNLPREYQPPINWLLREGRVVKVRTTAYTESDFRSTTMNGFSFDLAELDLSEDGEELTLRINEGKNIAIDPVDLVKIGKIYQL